MKSIKFFENKTVLIAGAAGSVGGALSRRLAQIKPKQLLLLDQDETGIFDLWHDIKDQCNSDYIIASIREWETINLIFRKYKPDLVIHAAAYKHVVPMEKYPDEAFKTNVMGTMHLVKASILNGVKKFVFIGTDKAVYPISAMGITKNEAERICLRQTGDTKFIVVRFGNILASRGSVVPIFQKAIQENRPLIVTHKDMQRFIMGIYEAVDLILQATILGKGGEIFVLDMGKQMFIRDLADLMIKISGKPLEIEYSSPGPGEKFYEQLMTKEEEKKAKKIGKLYVIQTTRR